MMLMMMRVSDDGVEMVSSPIAVVILDIRSSTIVARNMNLEEAGNMIVVRLVMVILKVRMVTRNLEEQAGEHLSK